MTPRPRLLPAVALALAAAGGASCTDETPPGGSPRAGALDTSFDGTGRVITPVGPGSDLAMAIAVQDDGRIVVAGRSHDQSRAYFSVVRYESDGGLDTTFDGTGKVVTAVRTVNDYANAVAVQPDGKIVVAGWSASSQSDDFAVVRYAVDGSLDTGFDATGSVIADFDGYRDRANAVAIQGDGKIVVAGTAFTVTGGVYDKFAMVRYNADGTEDIRVVTAVGSGASGATAVAIQPDGKIVLGGQAGGDFAVIRLTASGALDTSFNGTGKVTTPIGTGSEQIASIALQPDGKIVAVGDTGSGTGSSWVAAVRYAADGNLDSSFNGTGKVTTAVQVTAVAYAVAIQDDGKIVVAGHSYGSENDFLVVRYRTDGSLDTTFAPAGYVLTDIGGYLDIAQAVAIQGDGKIVAAGYTGDGSVGSGDFALARYWP